MLKVRSKFSVFLFFDRTFSFRITEGIIEEINDNIIKTVFLIRLINLNRRL